MLSCSRINEQLDLQIQNTRHLRFIFNKPEENLIVVDIKDQLVLTVQLCDKLMLELDHPRSFGNSVLPKKLEVSH